MTANIEQQIRSVCAEYVEIHGEDLETPDYLRLTARVWEILGRMSQPNMFAVDEIVRYLNEEAEADNNDFIPGVRPMGELDRGASLSTWKERNEEDIREAMVHIVGQVTA